MPNRVQSCLRDATIGFGIAAIFFGGAVMTDLAGLQSRLWSGEMSWQIAVIAYFATGLLFTLVQNWLSQDDGSDLPKPPRGGRRREAVRVTVPVRNRRR